MQGFLSCETEVSLINKNEVNRNWKISWSFLFSFLPSIRTTVKIDMYCSLLSQLLPVLAQNQRYVVYPISWGVLLNKCDCRWATSTWSTHWISISKFRWIVGRRQKKLWWEKTRPNRENHGPWTSSTHKLHIHCITDQSYV